MNEQKLEKQKRNLVDRGLLSPDEKLYGSITINYTEKLAGRIETWKRGGAAIATPENDDLLYLEWETDISKAIIYVRTHIDYKNLNLEQFGRILMSKLKVDYKNCPDIKYFASQMYRLWESLPGNIQKIEPFWTLCYADDPLAWGDEKQTRDIYEHMLRYYEGSS